VNKRQAKRWLATNSLAWRKLRQVVLDEEPLCRLCIQENVKPINPSSVVDHIDGDSETQHGYRRSNLMGLCETHHNVKTALENGSFGRLPGAAKRRGCDVHGTPLDRTHPWNRN
jgi:5-methylcytosine-specific restriction protein A